MVNETYQAVEHWLTEVVIGLNLCPFAARPKQLDQIDIIISDAQTLEQLLIDLQQQMQRLVDTPAIALETTLVATPYLLADFDEYNQFLNVVDKLLVISGYDGTLQIASFHPNYQFDGSVPDDIANFTNRSPVPIFHLIRELSITMALASYSEPEKIPARNIARLKRLSTSERQRLFHYLMS